MNTWGVERSLCRALRALNRFAVSLTVWPQPDGAQQLSEAEEHHECWEPGCSCVDAQLAEPALSGDELVAIRQLIEERGLIRGPVRGRGHSPRPPRAGPPR